ncbi:MAG: nitronate monooxygenase [Oligoflexia bacterium]|nr:nitronate monooxygenase [Oligoflexia bacterium]
MGIRVSTSSLAAAVINAGAVGTLSGLALGYDDPENATNYEKASRNGLIREIRKTKELTRGPVGINILVAASNYRDLVQTSCRENVDFIVSGAGLPLMLPELVENTRIKLIPIVSSGRATNLIITRWIRKYNRLPDAVIVEGPLAGGHLGYSLEDILSNKVSSLEKTTAEVISLVSDIGKRYNREIPVIPAGGIFDGKDIARFLKLGAKGVQIATRFVVTKECSVPDAFKQLYISAGEDDIEYIQSPVGMPGRVINTKFSASIKSGKNEKFTCNYRCLRACNPGTAKFCVAQALYNASQGLIDRSIIFAGSSVSRIKKMTTVNELLSELVEDTLVNL